MPMLTTETLARFKGGQMEVQNQLEGYLYRGEIETIVVEDNELRIRFSWFAKGEGFPPFPKKWVKDDHLDYAASLKIYRVDDVGSSGGDIGGDSRLALFCSITQEIVVLFPPNGSKLDRAQVEGL